MLSISVGVVGHGGGEDIHLVEHEVLCQQDVHVGPGGLCNLIQSLSVGKAHRTSNTPTV